MTTEPVQETAWAKLNLCLHVTGRRADGYHLLDSLVAFALVGDLVEANDAADLTLSVTGPEAASLAGEQDNLVLRAARAMGVTAALSLHKELPVASGIGGGSSDAAATLRALSRLTGRPLPDRDKVLALGADVPVCLSGEPARMRGIGEDLSPLSGLPKAWVVLANLRQAVSTPDVFARLDCRANLPVRELPPTGWPTVRDLAHWLQAMTRNDLQAAAIALVPGIAQVLGALAGTRSCLLARMSGSGATCFGLFEDEDAARAAATDLRAGHPGWWVREAAIHTGK